MFPQGQPRQRGAAFASTLQGNVLTAADPDSGDRSMAAPGGIVASMGEARIANNERIRTQAAERIFRGAPKFWKITNRAEKGNVKVWTGVFSGEVFPEGADPDDRRTWLQPGDSIILSLEAGLHFFGNVFDPRSPEALEVIERFGGFVLEGKKKTEMRDAPRIIGGPIGLPDFIIEPIDGRMRRVGEAVAVYERYDRATRRLWKLPTNTDPELLQEERQLLQQRIAEYTLEDAPIFDARGNRIDGTSAAMCDCSPIAHMQGVVGCKHSPENSQAVILKARSSNDVEKPEPEEPEEVPDMRSVDPEPEEETAETPTARRGKR